MDDKLRAMWEELKDAVDRSEADGVIDDDERAELRTLLDRLDTALARRGEEEGPEDEGLTDALEDAAVQFESRFPDMTNVIRSAIDTLVGFGI